MAKRQPNDPAPTPHVSLDAHSTPKQRDDANRAHHSTLIGHALDAAAYNGHGHYVGRHGPAGHAMVPSGDKGKHAYIPQGVLGAAQNRQSTFSDGAGSAAADDAASSDYGKVDCDK